MSAGSQRHLKQKGIRAIFKLWVPILVPLDISSREDVRDWEGNSSHWTHNNCIPPVKWWTKPTEIQSGDYVYEVLLVIWQLARCACGWIGGLGSWKHLKQADYSISYYSFCSCFKSHQRCPEVTCIQPRLGGSIALEIKFSFQTGVLH